MNRQIPTRDEVLSYLRDRSNWGRWPDNPSAGALNLIDDAKRLAAAKLVRKGRAVSLSRPFPTEPSIENPRPALQYLFTNEREGGWGSSMDFYGITYHGTATTHIDALCHIWTPDGMWDGRDPKEELTFSGAKYGSVDAWSEGILTRGVLLDVPKHRGKPYVTLEEPVHGWELEDILEAEGITLEPGDAVAFDFRTLHSARANSRATVSSTLSFRLLGDDATYRDRGARTSPDFPDINQTTGERLREDWFPLIFQAGQT